MSKIIKRIFNFCFETKITVKYKILKYILIFICAVLFEMIALVALYILSIFISPENYVFILTPVLSGLVIGYFYSQNRKWIKSINDTLLFSSAALKAIDEVGNIFFHLI